jgi:hypothetical protein
VDILKSRGKKLRWGFTAYNRDFNIHVRRAVLERSFGFWISDLAQQRSESVEGKPEVNVNDMYKFSSCRTQTTQYLHYKD